MSTFDEILNKAKQGADIVGRKTSDFVEVTRLRMAVSDVEKEIAETFEGLGRLVYDARKSGEDVDEMITACIENVEDLEEEADMLREQIYAYKNMRKCKECGSVNASDAEFCNKCGAKLCNCCADAVKDAVEVEGE
ncbi:MAG: hypothetical protein J6Z00_04750 [Clostridia bacterium]|nr:hypothetical protein [Clostridia bacterium]